jgi:hypothetical protein
MNVGYDNNNNKENKLMKREIDEAKEEIRKFNEINKIRKNILEKIK